MCHEPLTAEDMGAPPPDGASQEQLDAFYNEKSVTDHGPEPVEEPAPPEPLPF